MGDEQQAQVLGYLRVRQAIGLLGIAFPVLLAVLCMAQGDCTVIQDTVSAYYHTAVRDVFVGVLFALALFLFSYQGYPPWDNLAGNLACLFTLGVALCPTHSDVEIVRTLHTVSATALFLTLAFFCFFLFTKTDPDVEPTPRKLVRNRVYRVCGAVIVACVALIAVYFAALQDSVLARLSPAFWLEAIALWAFGFSWVTKGEALWPDRD